MNSEKDTYYKKKVALLSKKARRILKIMNVNSENIGLFTQAEFVRCPGCGFDTSVKIANLISDMNSKYPIDISLYATCSIDSLCFYTKKYFSSKALKALEQLQVKTYADLHRIVVSNQAIDLVKMQGVGQITIREICDFYRYIFHNLSEKDITYLHKSLLPIEQLYEERKGVVVDYVLEEMFNQMLSELWATEQRHISWVYQKYTDLIYGTRENRRIESYSSQTQKFVLNQAETFKLRFFNQAEKILLKSEDELKLDVLFQKFPFFKKDEKTFIRNFYETTQRYPVFFIMKHYLSNTNPHRNRATIFYAQYIGLDTEKLTMTEIASKNALSRERVRQLIYHFTYAKVYLQIPFITDEMIEHYTFLKGDVFTAEEVSSICSSIALEENVDIDPHIFRALCVLLNPSLFNKNTLSRPL